MRRSIGLVLLNNVTLVTFALGGGRKGEGEIPLRQTFLIEAMIGVWFCWTKLTLGIFALKEGCPEITFCESKRRLILVYWTKLH